MITKSEFRAAWWLPGPHLQTLWPRIHRRPFTPYLCRERITLPDNDFLDLDWGPGKPDWPLVALLHGLGGSSASVYARALTTKLSRQDIQVVVMHFRGCSGKPNRLPRTYHSGDTGDFDFVTQMLSQRFPGRRLGAVGYSLGGNVLLKWLGERGGSAPISVATAISVPFDLATASDTLNHGFSRIYQWALLRDLGRAMRAKAALMQMPEPCSNPDALKSFREFDEHITAPLHGFASADDYYERASCLPFLNRISVPTLILQAENDPFFPCHALPGEHALSDQVTLETSKGGGHVGFVTGRYPWRPEYWLEKRIAEFLGNKLRGGQDPP